jgi:hypothetical protein
VRGLAGALDALVAAGWVTVEKVGRTKQVALTAAGEVERARVPAPAVKKKPKTAADRIAALEERVAKLEALLAPPATKIEIKDAVLGAVADLDARGRLGGLVPIPDLRAALRERGVRDDDAVTRALEDLERDWKIDLNVAQAPTAVADRAAGIERPGRGLLYYVSRR